VTNLFYPGLQDPPPGQDPTGARRPQRRQGAVDGSLLCRLADLCLALAHAPSGEWSGLAEWCVSRDLIDRRVRNLGRPSVRAAFGGSLNAPLEKFPNLFYCLHGVGLRHMRLNPP
jgi:hypothetical protein